MRRREMMKREQLDVSDVFGTIQLGEKVRITDPCYNEDVWCAGTLDNVLPGEYQCFAEVSDEGEWGNRVAAIMVSHNAHVGKVPTEPVPFEVGVDSGQAGIFDYQYWKENHQDDNYDNPQSWYRRVCDVTTTKPRAGLIEGKGLVSRSGYGDGGYDAFIATHNGKIVAIRIVFISEDED